jgi:hypothetical protein
MNFNNLMKDAIDEAQEGITKELSKVADLYYMENFLKIYGYTEPTVEESIKKVLSDINASVLGMSIFSFDRQDIINFKNEAIASANKMAQHPQDGQTFRGLIKRGKWIKYGSYSTLGYLGFTIVSATFLSKPRK